MSSHHSTTHTSWRGRTRLAPLGLLLTLALAYPAAAQEPRESGRMSHENPPRAEKLIRILQPDGNLLTALPVDVVVRLHPSADADTFRATLNGHDITGQFSRHGRQWRAAVLPGDGLVEGVNRLRVRVRGRGRVDDIDLRAFEFSHTVGDMPPTTDIVKVQTRVGTDPGPYSIQVGAQQYSISADVLDPFGLLIVAWDRRDLSLKGLKGQQFFNTSASDGCPAIVDFLNARLLGEIVIVSTGGSSGLCNTEVGNALAQFGANPEIAGLSIGETYTFLGVKGWGYDQAYQIIGPGSLTGLTGYFVKDSYGNYTFLQPDYVKVQVKDPAQPGLITIGRAPYVPPGGVQGFQVLLLDRYSLTALNDIFDYQWIYNTNSGDPDIDLENMQQMARDLNAAADRFGERALAIITNIGPPFPSVADMVTFNASNSNFDTTHGNITIKCRTRGSDIVSVSSGTFGIGFFTTIVVKCPADHPGFTGDWSWTYTGSGTQMANVTLQEGVDTRSTGLPAAVKRFGGNPYVFEQLGYFDDYALVGSVSPGYKNAPAFPSSESSSVAVSGVEAITVNETGAIRGMLGRGHRGGLYEPIASDFDLAVPVNYDLYTIAWQAPTAWPFPLQPNLSITVCPIGGAPTAAGLQAAYTYAATKLCSGCDVRATYNDDPQTFINYNSVFNNELLHYPAGNGDFTGQEFCMVRTELLTETRWATAISGLSSAINGILQDAIGDKSAGTIHDIMTDLESYTAAHPTSPVVIDILDVLGALAAIGSAIVSPVQPAVAAALGVVSAVIETSASLAGNSSGGPSDKIEAAAENLEDQSRTVLGDVKTSLTRVFDLITSDYGKMKMVGEPLVAQDAVWMGPIHNQGEMSAALALTLKTYYYEQLLPLVYVIAENLNTTNYFPEDFACMGPGFPAAVYPSLNLSSGNNRKDMFVFSTPALTPTAPPTTLTNTLFKTPVESETSLGVPKIRFFTEWLEHIPVCKENGQGIATRRSNPGGR